MRAEISLRDRLIEQIDWNSSEALELVFSSIKHMTDVSVGKKRPFSVGKKVPIFVG